LAIIYVLREIPVISAFQVTQETIGRLLIRLVPEGAISPNDRQMIQAKAKRLLGHDVEIVIEEADSIPVSASGKFRYVISKVALASPAVLQPSSPPRVKAGENH
jgi:phenylacetate-CoA ligase